MEFFLPFFIIIPLIGFITSLIIPSKNENAIFLCMAGSSGLQSIFAILFTLQWFITKSSPLNVQEIILYNSSDYSFFIDLFFDEITATYVIMSSMLTFMIAHFSRQYMHKDFGYKRYFNTMLLYFLGVQIIIFSGNLETLFIGWEFLGVSSFLLIAYYRNRYLPVRNGFKVFSLYRIADMGILLAMWLLHHLFHENITFIQLNDSGFIHEHLNHHYWVGILISLFIVLAALVKSAQFPFSSWLPRAMEGPTPSSSIFYGSIAVHIGIYLLLRTYPFWSQFLWIKVLVIVLGLTSLIISNSIAQVQYSIKGQIAYSSIAQIGIMMIEVALGFEFLALIHLVGNSFLRSYQLLISPSIATYVLREQLFNFKPKKKVFRKERFSKFTNTMYVLSLNEFYMDNMIYKYLWFPIKRLGGKMAFINTRVGLIIFLIGGLVFTLIFNEVGNHSINHHKAFPIAFSLVALSFVLRSFTIRKHPFEAWILLVLNHFFVVFAISINESFDAIESLFYLAGIVSSGIVGFITLYYLRKREYYSLDDYYGHTVNYKVTSAIFLICSLSLMGFPISSTFLGEDLLFSHIHSDQILLMTIVSLNFMIGGIAIMRIYARIFLGPNHLWENIQSRRSA